MYKTAIVDHPAQETRGATALFLCLPEPSLSEQLCAGVSRNRSGASAQALLMPKASSKTPPSTAFFARCPHGGVSSHLS